MKELTIHTESKTYPVFVGEAVLKGLQHFIKEKKYTHVFVISEENVSTLHRSYLEEQIGRDVQWIDLPSGEEAKTFQAYFDAQTKALESNLDRKSVILAFGGGAIGDVAGFVAATYMRGISFIGIPTTLLAHDSSVGGKVAINHPLGKNMIGAFHQPDAVFYDLHFLQTLPLREVRSGFAEVIKHSMISNSPFFSELTEKITNLHDISQHDLQWMITEGILVKESIVSQDEREAGIRAYLNFGHTLGHAIEKYEGFGGLRHGEAIAIGMCFALYVSGRLYGLSGYDQAYKYFEQLGYPLHDWTFDEEALLSLMKGDKKSSNGAITLVLLEKWGHPTIRICSEEEVKYWLNEFKKGAE